MAIGFSINVSTLGQRVLKCKAQQPAIEIAATQTMSASADWESQPAIEIAATQTMSASGRTGKFEFQPAEAGFVCVDAVSTALSIRVKESS